MFNYFSTLKWRKYLRRLSYICVHGHDWWWPAERPGVSDFLQLECWFNSLFGLTAQIISKLPITATLWGNPPVTSGFPSQRVSNSESFLIPWRPHETSLEGSRWQWRVKRVGGYHKTIKSQQKWFNCIISHIGKPSNNVFSIIFG